MGTNCLPSRFHSAWRNLLRERDYRCAVEDVRATSCQTTALPGGNKQERLPSTSARRYCVARGAANLRQVMALWAHRPRCQTALFMVTEQNAPLNMESLPLVIIGLRADHLANCTWEGVELRWVGGGLDPWVCVSNSPLSLLRGMTSSWNCPWNTLTTRRRICALTTSMPLYSDRYNRFLVSYGWITFDSDAKLPIIWAWDIKQERSLRPILFAQVPRFRERLVKGALTFSYRFSTVLLRQTCG